MYVGALTPCSHRSCPRTGRRKGKRKKGFEHGPRLPQQWPALISTRPTSHPWLVLTTQGRRRDTGENLCASKEIWLGSSGPCQWPKKNAMACSARHDGHGMMGTAWRGMHLGLGQAANPIMNPAPPTSSYFLTPLPSSYIKGARQLITTPFDPDPLYPVLTLSISFACERGSRSRDHIPRSALLIVGLVALALAVAVTASKKPRHGKPVQPSTKKQD